jgi:hypothetical protein
MLTKCTEDTEACPEQWPLHELAFDPMRQQFNIEIDQNASGTIAKAHVSHDPELNGTGAAFLLPLFLQ